MANHAALGIVRTAPLLGRDPALTSLDEALSAVTTAGKTSIVTIVGPAGVGKSRLVSEFISRHRSDASTPRVYVGSAKDGSGGFTMFARLLRARFGLVEGMAEDLMRQHVRNQVANVLEDRKVGDVLYFLGQLLDIPFDESPLTRAVRDDPSQAELLRRAVFKSFLEADASHSPLVLVFEDLHEAHEDSHALLRYLLEYISGSVMILCVARGALLADQEDWPRVGERRHRVLDLSPLGEDDAATMMRHLLAPCEADSGTIPEQLVEAATNFAGGVPQLLEQMVRIYHDKGVLEETGELSGSPIWRVNIERLAQAQLPLTVEDAIEARTSALSSHERRLLEMAAVMGTVFWTAGFTPLLRLDREVPDDWTGGDSDELAEVEAMLQDLAERDYILRLPDSTFPDTVEYVFKHNKERDAIAQRAPSGLVKRYHEAIADWLEQQHHVLSTSEEFVAAVADHRERSADRLRAGLSYLDAGDHARSRYATTRASEYYERGLELVGDAHVARRIDALHNYGDVLQVSGRVDDALATFREMLALAYRLNLTSKGGAAHNRIGRLYRDLGTLDEAGKHLHIAMDLFEAAGDERGVASTRDDIGKLQWLKGEYEQALETIRDALGRRRRLGDRRSIALSFNNLGLVLQDSGRFKEALEAFDQALTIRREIGDLVGVVTSLNNVGCVAQDQEDFERALRLFGEALEVAKQIGDRNKIALVLTNIGEAHYRNHHPEKAIEVLRQAEEQFDELGDKLGLAEALRGLGKAYLLHGELKKARECIGRAVDLFAAVRSKVHLGVALRTLGEITAAGGWGPAHTKSAREYFKRSVTIFEQTGNDIELARTFAAYASFLRSEKQFAQEDAAQQEADAMDQRAQEIFNHLRISSIEEREVRPVLRDSN